MLIHGSDLRIRLADPTLETLPALFPEGFSRTNTPKYFFVINVKQRNTTKSIPVTVRQDIAAGYKRESEFCLGSVDPRAGFAGRICGSRKIISRVKVTRSV